jgi:hypothetical protein
VSFVKLITACGTESQWRRVLVVQEKLENAQGVIQKYTQARKYERVSRETLKIVEVTLVP